MYDKGGLCGRHESGHSTSSHSTKWGYLLLNGSWEIFLFLFFIKKEFGKPRYLIFSHLPAYHDASFVATFSFIIIYLVFFAHLVTRAIDYPQQASSPVGRRAVGWRNYFLVFFPSCPPPPTLNLGCPPLAKDLKGKHFHEGMLFGCYLVRFSCSPTSTD
jgi:hypothetical protein